MTLRLEKVYQQLLPKKFISKLANKLQENCWLSRIDLGILTWEGLLDTSKLPRIIMDPLNSLSFKKKDIESEA